jgi:protein O-GlcNAc transferase
MQTNKPKKNIYISLTSIYDNQEYLCQTIASILSQTKMPDKIFLFLSEESYLLDKGFKGRNINDESLKKLLDDNDRVEVRWVDNDGPYRKIIPLLKEKWDEDCVIITVDDDTVYDSDFIKNILEPYKEHHCCVGLRGDTMDVSEDRLRNWTYAFREELVSCSLFNFYTGKGGVLYRPSFFHKTPIVLDRGLYGKLAPTADDVWLNLCRIANGVRCYIGTQNYQVKDNSNESCALYRNYNRGNNSKQIKDVLNYLFENNYLNFSSQYIEDSSLYWEDRYKSGDNSGVGSYNKFAEHKGDIINSFIIENNVDTIIDLGCGDGNQLRYFNFKHYIGYDISPTAIATCQELFKDDKSKEFKVLRGNPTDKATMVLSLDVLYHLVEDDVYIDYLDKLFNCSLKYVVIYANDQNAYRSPHIRFRKFTDFIEDKYRGWTLIKVVKNKHKCIKQSPSDFYFFEKKAL